MLAIERPINASPSPARPADPSITARSERARATAIASSPNSAARSEQARCACRIASSTRPPRKHACARLLSTNAWASCDAKSARDATASSAAVNASIASTHAPTAAYPRPRAFSSLQPSFALMARPSVRSPCISKVGRVVLAIVTAVCRCCDGCAGDDHPVRASAVQRRCGEEEYAVQPAQPRWFSAGASKRFPRHNVEIEN